MASHELYDGVQYMLDRIQTDPNVRYYCGFGTECFHRLCKAEAAHLGKPLAEIEAARRQNLTPAYHEQRPHLHILQDRIDDLIKVIDG